MKTKKIITSTEIKKATKDLTFKQINNYIEKLDLNLELIQNLPFSKMWKVKYNKEFCYISNTLKELNGKKGNVTFVFND